MSRLRPLQLWGFGDETPKKPLVKKRGVGQRPMLTSRLKRICGGFAPTPPQGEQAPLDPHVQDFKKCKGAHAFSVPRE